MRFVVYHSATDTHPHANEATWDDLVALFSEVTRTPCAPCIGKKCPHKNGLAWSPVVLQEGTRRLDVNVLEVTAAVLDLDDLTEAQVLAAAEHLEGLRYIAHSTHTHRPNEPEWVDDRTGTVKGGWRLRIILALSRPVPAGDWRRFLATLVSELDVPADPTCENLSRIYFLPSVAEGGAFLAESGEGEPLDVDAILSRSAGTHGPSEERTILASVRARAGGVSADSPAGPVGQLPVDLGVLRKAMIDLRTTYRRAKDDVRAQLVDDALEGRALAPDGRQSAALHALCCTLACKFPPNTPAEAAVEILRRSIVAMGAGPEGLDAWFLQAAKSYTAAHAERLESDARVAEANARLRTGVSDLIALRASRAAPAPAEGVESDPEEEDDWEKDILKRPITKEGEDPAWLSNEHNAEVVLRCSPAWKGLLRYNDVRHEVEVVGDAPIPEHGKHPDALPRAVGNWLQCLKINLSEASVASTLLLVARGKVYDPVKDYLDAHDWDGEKRIATFLETHARAVTRSSSGEDITDHVRRMSAKWFISAAARGLKPGSKVDTVLILEGRQGAKKSSLFEVLGGPYYAVARMDMTGKDSLMVLARSWIVELAELSALRKADSDEAKSFFSTNTDVFRLPYGRAVSEVPRRSVCGGTVNPTEEGYLTDRTGNRRYWVVKVGDIDLPAVRRDRDQLFAEAAHHARLALAALAAGEEPAAEDRWWLSDDESRAAEEEASDRLTSDSMVETLERMWDSKPKIQRPATFTLADATHWISMPAERVNRAMEIRIGRALHELGFGRIRGPRDEASGRRPWLYTSTELQRAKPERKADHPGAHIAAVIDARKAS